MSVEENVTGTLRKESRGHEPVIAFTQNQAGDVLTGNVMHNIGTNSNATGRNAANVAFPLDLRNAGRDADKHDEMNRQGCGTGNDGDPSGTVSSSFIPGVATTMQVRRLTPVECEKLQGFSPGHTAIKHKGKPAADGPRYKAIGNSMAVPVMSWIGRRIEMVDEILKGRP